MLRRTRVVFFATSVCALVGGRLAGTACADPAKRPVPTTTLYHRDPAHLWNRVHAALMIRSGPDRRPYGQDRLEPLLWADSDHLLKGVASERAAAVLDEFARDNGERLIDDPVKWAVLHRDLWMVSNWLAGTADSEAKRQLASALARVLARLALTPEQIGKLPDNFAATVAAKRYPDRYDPTQPQQAYLPPDLFRPNGPWACVGPPDGPSAPFHLDDQGTNRLTNSAFLVFLKLPDGRAATRAFLDKLATVDDLLVANDDAGTKRLAPRVPNPDLPAWPKGTEVALVRRALLIDVNRRIAVSPLTESVQFRVVTDTPALTAEVLGTVSSRKDGGWNAFSEFQLRRVGLFEDAAGGLRDISGERDFKTGFGSHPFDEFGEKPSPAATDGPFPERSQPFRTTRASCVLCHAAPGVGSFNSLPGFAFGGQRRPASEGGGSDQPRRPVATTVAAAEKRAVEWKERQPAWAALRKQMEK